MGSWSVYCGVSRIAITAGHDMVLLPIKESKSHASYLPWIPATLPIFGTYDDYGGIEEIIEDDNTKKIESYFGLSILDFTKVFTDLFAYDRDETKVLQAKLEENGKWDEIKDWSWMFIDRQVYDYMTKPNQKDYETGHHDFGNPGILKLMGAEYIGEETGEINDSQQPSRYKHHWKLQGKNIFTDGTWSHYKKQGLYSILGKWSSFECGGFEISDKWKELNTKASSELWRHYDKHKKISMLGWIIGKNEYDSYLAEMDEIIFEQLDDILTKGSIENWTDKDKEFVKKFQDKKDKKVLKLHELYFEDLEKFGDKLSELVIFRHNLYPMSSYFQPFVHYVTPQCGEYSLHQTTLEKFTEINKSYTSYEEEE